MNTNHIQDAIEAEIEKLQTVLDSVRGVDNNTEQDVDTEEFDESTLEAIDNSSNKAKGTSAK